MRNLKYAARQVFKSRWSNAIKLISLTLGLVVGSTLFVRVAFERSFDADLKDVERIYRVEAIYKMATGEKMEGDRLMAPVVPTLQANIPQIERSTRFFTANDQTMTIDNTNFVDAKILIADSAFFDVFGYDILRGDPKKGLSVDGNIYLSVSQAKKLFGSSDPIGRAITISGQYKLSVAGIFVDPPASSHNRFDAVTYISSFFPKSWDGGDSFSSYVKLAKGVSEKDVTAKFKAILDPYHKFFIEKSKIEIDYFLHPVRNIFIDSVDDVNVVMAILAFVVVLVSALNYVLLTLSSLASRLKEVGVHKASGASTKGIFAIIMWETFLYVVMAVILAAFIIGALRGVIEPVMGSFDHIFTLSNGWALVVVVGLLFIFSGVIPAAIFCRVSVMQIFRSYSEGKMLWKRALLFFQFSASAFIVAFVLIVVMQYSYIVNRHLGYNADKVAYVALSTEKLADALALRSQIEAFSGVGEVSLANSLPMYGGGSGIGVSNPETMERIFRGEMFQIDERFMPLFKMAIIKGRNITAIDSASVVVNEAFVAKLPPSTNPLGYTFAGEGQLWSVVGVIKDFKLGSAYASQQPCVFTSFTWTSSPYLIIRFSDYSEDNVEAIVKHLRQMYPQNNFVVNDYADALYWQHLEVENLRNGVLASSLVLLFITFLGVVGYTATEIRRRRREMALRKIHGATYTDITLLIMRSLLIICCIATVCGAVMAYIFGQYWQSQFVDKAPFEWWIFGAAIVVVISMVVVTVSILTRRAKPIVNC